MAHKSLRRFLTVTASLATLALAAAPMGFAGEDGDDDEGGGSVRVHHSSGGGGDSGSASGGIQTGAGGMITASTPTTSIPIALAGGGIALLTFAGGLASRKRRFE